MFILSLGSFTSRGQLIKILPHYPLDGQPATLEVHENLAYFEEVRKELLSFPGPLVKYVRLICFESL